MKSKDNTNELDNASRRNFLKLTAAGSFTAAMVAGAAGTLWSEEAVAQTAAEEREREKAADHTMLIATAYVVGASRSYPIMQLDLKENIQNATNGKVYVKLAPGGQLGAGGAKAKNVSKPMRGHFAKANVLLKSKCTYIKFRFLYRRGD